MSSGALMTASQISGIGLVVMSGQLLDGLKNTADWKP